MKTNKYLFLMLLIALCSMNVTAQQRNILQVPDVTTQIGNAQLPVSIENTDEIVGVQFDLTLPEGVTAEQVGIMANRGDGHSVTVSLLSSGAYRVMLHSTQNRPLRGQSGVVMYLPITIPASFKEGYEYPLAITNAVLGKASGDNVLTEAMAGKIRISKLPDLTVKNITCDKQTLNPGDRIACSWQVENIGEIATGGGWGEQVLLISGDGTLSKLIATTHYDDILDASGIVSRQTEITLPTLLGMDGQVRLQVRIVPDSNTGESKSAQGNNIQAGTNLLHINKVLTLEMSPNRVDENSGRRIALRMNRSGRWTVDETFTMTTTADSRLSVPSTITIPAGQSGAVVSLSVTDNEVVDDISDITLSVEGNDYPAAVAHLTIEDNELPTLSVTSSKSEVNEGESFLLSIATSRISAQPITVTLTSENARRFTFPQQVVIPAGETSVTVDVVAVNNDEIELKESIAFHASADKYERGECIVLLNDNDMPALTFTLSPEAVSESDGYAALFGIIKRTDNLDKRVTLKLSDDSYGLLTYSNQTIVMAKNQTEVQFNIGVTDNDLVDGNHVVNVTAAVYASSCDCSVSEDNKGSMTATVTIIDDDGPTLKIKPAGTAILEGSENNVFTISHNVQSDVDVTVHISSDKDEILEYDHELTIPAGQNSANLLVNVKSNDQQDDSSIAAFKAEANGYSLGTCWILITDQTLPDATISLSADKTEVEAEGTVLLRAVVKNSGNASLRSTTPVEISFSGRNEKVKLTIGKTVAVGDSAVIEYNYDLPAITGSHTFEATVNAIGKVPELIYANNTSEKVSITILSPFSLTAQVDKDIYQQGESIHVYGVATGSAGKNAKVEVYFINEGARQTVSATTDEEGNYAIGWEPLSKQSGHFIVGACYPGAKEIEEMDAFDVYGIRAKDSYKTCELSQTDTKSGKIILTNPGNLAQTGLTVTPKTESDNCVFTFNAPASIDAGESVEIDYTITGNEISEGRDWQQMPLEITTAEGSHLDYTIYYYVYSLKARLQTNQSSINTTMTYGTPREYPVTVKNVGRAETGKITLALPNWIQAVTPTDMASLAQGDSTTILLRFIPTEAMKLNVRVSGQIGINCENGDGTAISFYLTPVSEEKGKLKVDVIDEYTYFTTEAPHVSNAIVKVKNPSTNEVVAEGVTAEDGTFTIELPEGYYSVTVDADKHDSYANTVIVDPGVEKEEEVFLSYQAITYSWDVVETEIEDEYEIETIVKYETRVPKPVVIISLPEEQPEPNSIVPVIITNQGLVNALDFNLSLSVSEDYTLEFLNAHALDVLAPQQSFVSYAKLVPIDNEEVGARVLNAKKTRKCLYIRAIGSYKEPCPKYSGTEHTRVEKYWGDCKVGGSGNGANKGGNSSGGSPGSPSGGGGGSSYGGGYHIDDVANPTKICDDKNNPEEDGSGDNHNPMTIVSDEPVPQTPPCDSDNEFHLVYKLVPVEGTRYEMKGVAADGVSQVKIVLDPELSKMPPTEDCDGNKLEYHWKWSLSENIGKLENTDSITDVIYTAPKDFPTQAGSMYPIEASLACSVNGMGMYFEPVPIEVVRVPVIMVHGLYSDPSCWHTETKGFVSWLLSVDWRNFKNKTGMYEYLLQSGKYDSYQLYTVDYESTHNERFETNKDIVGRAADRMTDAYLRKQYIVKMVDVIGHSMGGLLTKKYIQNHGGEKFHKVITINTPHGGSQFGNFMNDSNVQFVANEVKDKYVEIRDEGKPIYINLTPYSINRALLSFLYKEFASNSGRIDDGAVKDLSVGGEAINLINNNSTAGVKCHAIVTSSKLDEFLGIIFCAFGYPSSAQFKNELFSNDYSDLIVPVNSQKGGLSGNQISYSEGITNYTHITTCKNSKLQYRVLELLSESVNSTCFSNGFRRTPELSYDMPTLRKKIQIDSIYNSNNSILLSKINNRNTRKSVLKESNNLNSYLSINHSYIDGDTIVNIKVNTVGDFSEISFGCFYNDIPFDIVNSSEGTVLLPQKTKGHVVIMCQGKNSEGIWYSSSYTIAINTIGTTKIESIKIMEDSLLIINDEIVKPIVLCTWSDGTITISDDITLTISDENIAQINDGYLRGISSGRTMLIANYKGLTCTIPIDVYILNDNNDEISDESSSSICSTVTLSFKQKNVMTRQAFRGKLTVNNGNETTAMKDVKMNLEVRDMDGNLTTSHEFQIDAESLNGFTGNLDFTSGWTLEGGGTGVATILFIPTKYAAPTEPKDYSFGGSFSYTDPYTGLTVARDLNPVTLTVYPSPNLEMTYFMQRDVFGDDPLTETVEPMIPSEFALIVNNKGYGDAENMSLTTHQPEIIDNQKGLAISFELISTQLNGGDKNLSLGGSMISDFGTIPAHSQAYAQWWLQSSLLGHFIEYDVKATHLTSRNNPDLSLLDTVTVHELIHGFTVRTDGDMPLRGFLVNDIKDREDQPDEVYFTDATQQGTYIATSANIVKQSDTEYVLNVTAGSPGWNYGSLLDPTYGKQKLVNVTRADGTEVNVDNIWQTSCTLRDGKDPLYEKRLHFVGNMSADGETFYLTFEPKPELELEVESYTGVPEEGTVLKEQLTELTVKFNKPIMTETFTTEDITLYCQGIKQDASQIGIEKQNEQEYKLILNEVTLLDGYYVLTIQTAGIEDNEGFNGSAGKQATWIQYVDGKVALIVNISPAEGGTVTPESGRFIYDSDVILKATPAEGYSFSKWMIDNETVSTDAEFTYHLYRNTELTALFKESVFTGLQPLEGDALHVTITPLPLRDNMFVSGNFKEIQHVSIYDMRGIKCLGLNNIQSGQGIYVSNLKTGIYYVQIVTDRGIYRTKVIKR